MKHIILLMALLHFCLTRSAACGVMSNDYMAPDSALTDSASVYKVPSVENPDETYRLSFWRLVVPATLIAIGVCGVSNDWMEHLKREVREKFQENTDGKFTVDDYIQFAPAAAVYAFDLCGVKARHGIGDQTMILTMSATIMAAVTNGMKYSFGERRPDGTSRTSFPSRHTATAFMGAEMLRIEYNDQCPWVGVAGYAVAAGVGLFRMYNNRHWLNDVIAGAGVGILSTRMAYWLYPKLFGRKQNGRRVCPAAIITPYYNNGAAGVSASVVF